MTLRTRLTLTYSVIVAISLIAFGVALFLIMAQTLEREMDRRLLLRAGQVLLSIQPPQDSLSTGDLSTAQLDLAPLDEMNTPGVYVQILDEFGTVVATSASLAGATMPVDRTSLQAAMRRENHIGDVNLAQISLRTLTAPIVAGRRTVGILQVGQSRQPYRDTLRQLGQVLLILGAGALVLAGGIGWLVAYHGLRPLGTIARRATDIAAQRDFSKRVGLAGRRDEIGRLAGTVDALLATVEETVRQHREFVADTSHELRNPLLAIRTNLALLDRMHDERERLECLKEAREQADRMSRLVSDLLVLARTEAGQVVERRPVPLYPVVKRAVQDAQARAAGRVVTLSYAEPVCVLGDEGRLVQVLDNLIDNAIQHTPEGGSISVRLEDVDDFARLSVADTGEGIPPEHLSHLFERFYRVNRYTNQGTGLGLAIVKHLTEAHGGRVTVESIPAEGSRFSIWLPLLPGPPVPSPRAIMFGDWASPSNNSID